jgi:hypothetical protein
VTRQKKSFKQLSSKPYELRLFLSSFFFSSLIAKNVRKEQKKMSATKQYIQAETSSRIDACFGGVVVEHESHKFQYYQDRNKRWPFTCSEKGCELFVLEKRSKCSRSRIFSSSLNFLSLTERNQNQRHFVVSAFDWSLRRVYSSGFWLFFFSRLVGRFLSF